MQPHHVLAMHRRHIDETRALLDRHEAEHVQLRIASKGVRGAAHHAMVNRHNTESENLKGRHAAEARGETVSSRPRGRNSRGEDGLRGNGGHQLQPRRHVDDGARAEPSRSMGDTYSTMK
jgi:hypothetical protein